MSVICGDSLRMQGNSILYATLLQNIRYYAILSLDARPKKAEVLMLNLI